MLLAIHQEPPNKQSDRPDPFKPLRMFIGKWEGDSKGQPGIGKMEREYSFVLKDRFIQISNKAVYAPQEKNPKGEVHEDLGFFGYDKACKSSVTPIHPWDSSLAARILLYSRFG